MKIRVTSCRSCPFAVAGVMFHAGGDGTPAYHHASLFCRAAPTSDLDCDPTGDTLIVDPKAVPEFCPLPVQVTRDEPPARRWIRAKDVKVGMIVYYGAAKRSMVVTQRPARIHWGRGGLVGREIVGVGDGRGKRVAARFHANSKVLVKP